MSSLFVRDSFKTFIAANNNGEPLVDLTAEYRELKELMAAYNITFNSPWMAIEFIGNETLPITVGSNNTVGKYREIGSVYIHIVGVAKLGGAESILTRAQDIYRLLWGQRLGPIFIESATPPNFKDGTTLQFDGGFTAASIIVGYQYDTDL